MAQGPQKADHGGNFYITPRRMQNSVAWRYLSFRAKVVLQVFQSKHDGFNNGHLAVGIHDIGRELGNQNHGANAAAVAELIQKGFLELTADEDRKQGKVREYRITFVSTGRAKQVSPATHDYEHWRPSSGERRKFGSAKTATQAPDTGAISAPMLKVTGAEIASTPTVSWGFCSADIGAETALLIDNHSNGWAESTQPSVILSRFPMKRPAPPIGVDVDELRQWTLAAAASYGYGGQRKLAGDAGVPEPVLSRFRRGASLPAHYCLKLQEACGRALPYKEWRAAA
jgi:hypothetical protein